MADKRQESGKCSSVLLPRLWLSISNDTDATPQVIGAECDCACGSACPDSVESGESYTSIQALVQRVYTGAVQDIELNKDIHLDQIHEYIVALSATGEYIVVSDAKASCLFSYLDTSSRVEVLRQLVRWPDGVLEQVIALLLAAGILSSPQTERPGVAQDGSTTLVAWLHLTNRCNLSCPYCYVTGNSRQMDVATAQRAVDAVYRSALAHGYACVALKYAGGEPTLKFDALRAAQERAEILSARTGITLEAAVLTNGIRLDSSQVDTLLAHNVRVMVSLDGVGQYQDTQRPLASQKGSSFEYVSRSLDRLLARGTSPHILATITRHNIEGLPGLVEYLLDRGLRFSFNFYREPECSPAYSGLSFTPDEIIAGLQSAFRVLEGQLPRYSLLSNLSDRADLRMPHAHTCGVGRNYMVIDCDGSVAKCQMDMAHPVTTIDADDPLALVRADTDSIQNLPVDQKECRECVWRYRCAGGCPRLTFQRTGRYDAKSPLCEVYQAILPEVVRLEALRLVRYEEPWDFDVHRTGLPEKAVC
jgi:uncharacterized protein